jgi:hypothetical protein
MALNRVKVIKHEMVVEFTCPATMKVINQTIMSPNIGTGEYFSDWTYQYVEIKCSECNNYHKFEI